MRRSTRKAAQVARTRQKGRVVRVTTYNARTLAVKRVNGYGRDFSVLYEAARLDISVVGLQETRRADERNLQQQGSGSSVAGAKQVGITGWG